MFADKTGLLRVIVSVHGTLVSGCHGHHNGDPQIDTTYDITVQIIRARTGNY